MGENSTFFLASVVVGVEGVDALEDVASVVEEGEAVVRGFFKADGSLGEEVGEGVGEEVGVEDGEGLGLIDIRIDETGLSKSSIKINNNNKNK
jgi:hypothetical protein